MSSLAGFAHSMGNLVEGSDSTSSHITEHLQKQGITVHIGHHASHITSDIDVLVYSGAIKDNNVERVRARELGIPEVERSQFLAQVADMYDNVISVAGTHGKTTTTAMLADIFVCAGLKPTVHLGGESIAYGNSLLGSKHYFITEACEYRNSFGTLHSNTAVVTNIEQDHMDYYHNLGEIVSAFSNFVSHTRDNVVLWQNRSFAKKIKGKNVVVVGLKKCDTFFVCDIKRDSMGKYNYLIKYKGRELTRIYLNVCGIHNVKNSACAFAVAYLYGIAPDVIAGALCKYRGVARRFELLGQIRGVPVIADYAHHPTEIHSSIKSALISHKRILCVFQPHTYSRTKALMEQFIDCFEGVRKLVIYKTYEAREKLIPGGDAYDLYKRVNVPTKAYVDNIDEAVSVVENSTEYDLVLVLGAGDVYDLFKIALMREKYVD